MHFEKKKIEFEMREKKAKLFNFEKGKEKKAESMIKVCFAKRVTKDHVKFKEILNANPDDGKKSP